MCPVNRVPCRTECDLAQNCTDENQGVPLELPVSDTRKLVDMHFTVAIWLIFQPNFRIFDRFEIWLDVKIAFDRDLKIWPNVGSKNCSVLFNVF